MGVAELQEAWQEHSAAIAAEYEEWDANRVAAVPAYLDALTSFLRGRTDLETFRTRIDSLSKSEPHWGFRGTSQMFFNQLVKAADPAVLTTALAEALPEPDDPEDADRKLSDFQIVVEDTRDRAEVTGATKPGIGRIDSFVSFFWELQNREQWPILFPNSRDVLEQHELLDVNQPQPELYLAYRDVIQGLKRTLKTDTWGIEHLLWRLGQGAERREPVPEAGATEQDRPESGPNLYARYREEGLHFPDEVVTSLVLSLATKRFVILSGISGTGKTKIALGLAAYLDSLGPPARPPGATEGPRSNAENIYYRLTAAQLRRGSIDLKGDARELVRRQLGLPGRGQSRSYEARLPNGEIHQMRLGNIDFSDSNRELYRLHFGPGVSGWLQENGKPGDLLHLASSRAGGDFAVDVVAGSPAPGDDSPKRHMTIAVRSDWTDPRGLIGYFNPITTTYMPTGLINLLLRAADDPETPYLLILDEMNLARVEYYFSDFLSALESGEDLRLMSSGVEEVSAASSGSGEEVEVPGELPIPPNVCFVGTVNVDETTHAFSPKVLDRANVIEFSEVDVERALGHGVEKSEGGLRLRDGNLAPGWLCTPREEAMRPMEVAHEIDDFTGALEDVHAILAEFNLPFGYRVIDEVSAFVGHAIEKAEGEPEEIVRRAFDLQLQQKIVPKLSGGRELELPLAALLDYCLDGERRAGVGVEKTKEAAREGLKPGKGPPPLLYPGSARRILRMLDRLAATGFVGGLE